MKVLFVCSGNKSGSPSIIVSNQAESLKEENIEVEYYLIIGKGITGYLRNYIRLKKYLRNKHFDVIHAHYGLSGLVAYLCRCKPLVVSLMGSDIMSPGILRRITKTVTNNSDFEVIVKTTEMYTILNNSKVNVIPNGVNIKRFKPIDKNYALEYLKYSQVGKYVLFVSNPERTEKNYRLAMDAIKFISDSSIKLISVYDVPNKIMPYYMNMADTLLLTSLWEGSVNVVKEAMACGLPIVSTDVGDVKEISLGVEGFYISSFQVTDVANKLKQALSFYKRTNGRQRIIELGLDSQSIAKKIIKVYERLSSGKNLN